ncbi:hypothetical protein [Actinomadura kijaniata]|uniref:hypothetical protein n=1 Tax=Actinomadura kijaniata TaxID=46161 RepID=UPI00082FA6D1|nr:hypothetical protein [Actinomadura kijaniata]
METIAAMALGCLLVGAGAMHWIAPGYFRSLVPGWMPWAGPLVAVTGGLDAAAGALVLVPGTRALGAAAAALLISGYMVSHVDALVHARGDARFLDTRAGALARIAVNAVYVAWAAALAL